jgi:hypothetical protein
MASPGRAGNGPRVTNRVSAIEKSAASKPQTPESEMRPIIEYYGVDRGSLALSYPVANSPARRDRFRKFYADALERIQKLDFDSMNQEGKVDYVLFKNHLEHELRQLDIEEKQLAEIPPLIPFAKTIVDMEEARRRRRFSTAGSGDRTTGRHE